MQDASKPGGPAPAPETIVFVKLKRDEELIVLFPARQKRIRMDRGDPVYRVETLDGHPIVKLHNRLPAGLTMLDLFPPFVCLTRALSVA